MHHSPENFLNALVLDGVFERHPDLRCGAIELGASWVPGLMRNLDAAFDSFGRNEPLLQSLSLRPSEYLKRQVRFTPFPFEDVGWLIEQGYASPATLGSSAPSMRWRPSAGAGWRACRG